MLTRCVVVVDGAYLRHAAREQLDGGPGEVAMVQNAPALLRHLRALAEEATGEDLLRVYWYESEDEPLSDAAHLAAQPYLTVRSGQWDGALGAPASPLVRDLASLLDQLGCGDLLVCTADPSLAPHLERVQGCCRHVHWIQVGETDDPSTAALWAASDTRVYLSHAVVAESFRVAAAPLRFHAASTTVLLVPVAAPAKQAIGNSGDQAVLGQPLAAERPGSTAAANGTASSHPSGGSVTGPWRAWDDDGDPFARPRARAASDALERAFDAVPAATCPAPSVRWADTDRRRKANRGVLAEDDQDPTGTLAAIAAKVAEEVGPLGVEVVRRWQRGVPAEVDRQLLGASYGVLGRRLQQAEKIRLRQAFVAECERQAL